VGLLGGDLEVLQTCRRSDDGPHPMLSQQLLVGCCIEVPQQERPPASLSICGEDDVAGSVVLLGIIIMQHK
jgi:hypothetical protein